jgi:hypothetical protein
LVAVLVVVWDIFVKVFKGTPRIEVVEKVVKGIDVFFGRLFVAEFWDGLGLAEASLGGEDGGPLSVECPLCILGRWINICAFVYRVELTTFNRIRENFRS